MQYSDNEIIFPIFPFYRPKSQISDDDSMNKKNNKPTSAKHALNKTLSRLIQQVRANTAPDSVLEQANHSLQTIIELLEPHQFDGPYSAATLDGNTGEYNSQANSPAELMPYSPIIGDLNPISPQLEFSYVNKKVHGRGTFPATFTGPPNTVHGGMIAAAFDELLTAVVLANGPSAFTGTLSVRYLNPIAVGKEVELSAECAEIQKRKIFCHAEIRQHGLLCASAEAVFIYPKVE